MTLNEALDYIHSVNWRGSIPGLSRTRALLNRIGNPQDKLRYVHVAGTNGKGSTCAMLASILQNAGFRTGLYTSPYINRFNERMQIDATNVIRTPECAVLCTIGLDHMQVLGSTHTEIARTKAGIFKPGGVCVTYPALPEVDALYSELAEARSLRWARANFGRLHPISHSLEGQDFLFDGFGALRLSLLGRNQLHNAALVLSIVEALRQNGWRIPDGAVRDGLASVQWPGRFELLARNPDVIADGGHNVQCMLSLRENLLDYLPGRNIIAVTGVGADKEYEKMYLPVLPLIRSFIAVEPPNPRALPAPELANTLTLLGAEAQSAGSVEAGVLAALEQAKPGDCVLAFGSLYMLGQVRSCIFDRCKRENVHIRQD